MAIEVTVDLPRSLAKTRLFDLFEICWRAGEAFWVAMLGKRIARVVPVHGREVLFFTTKETLRGTTRIRMTLETRDIVVTKNGRPFAVIVRVEDYEKLTGAATTPPYYEENE